jgi:hypothetical protein
MLVCALPSLLQLMQAHLLSTLLQQHAVRLFEGQVHFVGEQAEAASLGRQYKCLRVVDSCQ